MGGLINLSDTVVFSRAAGAQRALGSPSWSFFFLGQLSSGAQGGFTAIPLAVSGTLFTTQFSARLGQSAEKENPVELDSRLTD